MTKGSGMIQPNMATTLGFVVTDAKVTPAELRPVLKRAISRTYNRISVDGDTSTNDMVCVLANVVWAWGSVWAVGTVVWSGVNVR